MDREADDWIAREKAKEIANSKVWKLFQSMPTFILTEVSNCFLLETE